MWESRSDFQALREDPQGLSTERHFHSPTAGENLASCGCGLCGFGVGKKPVFGFLHAARRFGIAHGFANALQRGQGQTRAQVLFCLG